MLAVRKRATLFLVLIFLCGLLSGAVGANLWRRMSVSADAVPAAPTGSVRPPSTPPTRKRAVEWFTEQLHLSSAQAQQLSQILEETRSEYHQQELQIESIRQESNTRIRGILTDEQKTLFDELLRTRSERRKNNSDRR
jgi:Spy/CpxP family protein refolding chaperone